MNALVGDPARLAALAGAGCAAMLLAAFFFQFVMGLAPCPLCVWQRWPHAVAALCGALALSSFGWRAAAAGAAAMAVGAGIAFYHVGVERGWWASAVCGAGGGPIGGLSTEELIARIQAAPLLRCDEIAWSLFGVSMAGWNLVASLGLGAALAAAALRLRGRAGAAHMRG